MMSFAKADLALWVQYLNRDLGLPVGLKETSLVGGYCNQPKHR